MRLTPTLFVLFHYPRGCVTTDKHEIKHSSHSALRQSTLTDAVCTNTRVHVCTLHCCTLGCSMSYASRMPPGAPIPGKTLTSKFRNASTRPPGVAGRPLISCFGAAQCISFKIYMHALSPLEVAF